MCIGFYCGGTEVGVDDAPFDIVLMYRNLAFCDSMWMFLRSTNRMGFSTHILSSGRDGDALREVWVAVIVVLADVAFCEGVDPVADIW